jgi:hypothetical protein
MYFSNVLDLFNRALSYLDAQRLCLCHVSGEMVAIAVLGHSGFISTELKLNCQ